jgi:hypothetical protein
MSDAKHTPGDWYAHAGEVATGNVDDHGDRKHIGSFTCNDLPDAEQEANARLAAAAPDLLVAVEEAMAWYTDDGVPDRYYSDGFRALLGRLRAAAAKAKGVPS